MSVVSKTRPPAAATPGGGPYGGVKVLGPPGVSPSARPRMPPNAFWFPSLICPSPPKAASRASVSLAGLPLGRVIDDSALNQNASSGKLSGTAGGAAVAGGG